MYSYLSDERGGECKEISIFFIFFGGGLVLDPKCWGVKICIYTYLYYNLVLCITLSLMGVTFRKIKDDSLPGKAKYIWSVIFPVRVSDGQLQLPCEARILKLQYDSRLQMVSSSQVQH